MREASTDNLEMMRRFYIAYKGEISETLSRKLLVEKSETPSRKLTKENTALTSREAALRALTVRFPLPWSHYVLLVRRSRSPEARTFYETEAIRGGWTVRQLQRQIDTQFYERTALSRNKVAMLAKGAKAKAEDAITPEEELKEALISTRFTPLARRPTRCRSARPHLVSPLSPTSTPATGPGFTGPGGGPGGMGGRGCGGSAVGRQVIPWGHPAIPLPRRSLFRSYRNRRPD